MAREEDQEEAGSLWEGREEGAGSGISKVARGRRDENFPTLHSVSLLIVTVLSPQTGFLNCIVCLP